MKNSFIDDLKKEIESQLETEKQRIFDEILHYPPPIPACDVQFNFLLEERSAITQELRRMREMAGQDTGYFDHVQAIREFVESSKYFDASLEAKLLADLKKVLDE